MRLAGRACISFEVGYGLDDNALYQTAAAFDFAHQHRALNRRQAKVGELVLVNLRIESTAGLLLDEERRDLGSGNFENQTEVLAYQFVVLRDLVANGAERAAARHPVPLLQRHLRGKPSFEIVPRVDVITERA